MCVDIDIVCTQTHNDSSFLRLNISPLCFTQGENKQLLRLPPSASLCTSHSTSGRLPRPLTQWAPGLASQLGPLRFAPPPAAPQKGAMTFGGGLLPPTPAASTRPRGLGLPQLGRSVRHSRSALAPASLAAIIGRRRD